MAFNGAEPGADSYADITRTARGADREHGLVARVLEESLGIVRCYLCNAELKWLFS